MTAGYSDKKDYSKYKGRSEEDLIIFVTNSPSEIRHIENPSENVQIAAIMQAGIKLIETYPDKFSETAIQTAYAQMLAEALAKAAQTNSPKPDAELGLIEGGKGRNMIS